MFELSLAKLSSFRPKDLYDYEQHLEEAKIQAFLAITSAGQWSTMLTSWHDSRIVFQVNHYDHSDALSPKLVFVHQNKTSGENRAFLGERFGQNLSDLVKIYYLTLKLRIDLKDDQRTRFDASSKMTFISLKGDLVKIS